MESYFRRKFQIDQKQQCQEFYSKHISRHFSSYITALVSFTPISPNVITMFMFPLGLASGLVMCFGTELAMFVGATLGVLLNVADTVDGELARFSNRTPEHGDYLDRLAHYVANLAIILGFSFGVSKGFGSQEILLVGFCAAIAVIFDDASRDLLITCGLQNTSSNRKKQKSKTRISVPGSASTFLQATSSVNGLVHIVFVIFFLSLTAERYFWDDNVTFWGLSYYLMYFTAVNASKSVIRALKIRNLIFTQGPKR